MAVFRSLYCKLLTAYLAALIAFSQISAGNSPELAGPFELDSCFGEFSAGGGSGLAMVDGSGSCNPAISSCHERVKSWPTWGY